MSYSQTWLEDPSAIRIVLIHCKVFSVSQNAEINIYLSNSGYTTTDGTVFLPDVVNNITIAEKFGSEDSISVSWGDIEVANKNGEYDTYLDTSQYIWTNRSIKIYYGDPGWATSISNISTVFLKIFDGVVADVDTRTISAFNIKLRDKMEKLNAPVTEAVIGTYGTWQSGQQNIQELKPVVFGEIFNMQPILIDPSQLEYLFSCSVPEKLTAANNITGNGASEQLIEIRDNGAPIYIASDIANYGGATVNLSNSTFKLLSPPAGELTVSVQGVKKSVDLTTGTVNTTYSNTLATIIALIVTTFGKSTTRLGADEVDWTNFNTFNTQNPYPVGLVINDTTNVLTACQLLAKSAGANIIISREGKLQIIKFGEPYGVNDTEITVDDIIYGSFEISYRTVPVAVKSINWGKNWSVQQNLTTAIPPEHKQEFAKEWREATATDSSVAELYKLEQDESGKDTLLIDKTSAEAEANKLLTYYKSTRTVFKFMGRSRLLSLKLGQPVTLKHHRFGLNGGKVGQVVGLTPDWTRGFIEVEVIV